MQMIRQHVTSSLDGQDNGVLCVAANPGVAAIPVGYERDGLALRCRVPRWSDVAHLLTAEPVVLLVVTDRAADPGRWLTYRGRAQLLDTPTDVRFHTALLQPERIDLVDEAVRWGVLDTLDL